MPARKLVTKDQTERFRAWMARLVDQEGLSAAEISRRWNADHPESAHLTPRAVLYHLHKLRRQHLEAQAEHVAALTDRTIRSLAAVANTDPRAVLSWSGSEVEVRDSDELTEDEAALVAGVSVRKVTRQLADGSSETTVEVKVDQHNRVQAATALLRFLHGSRIVSDSGAIIARLTEAGDRTGLQRISAGEDPVRVLIDRAPYLAAALAAEEERDA